MQVLDDQDCGVCCGLGGGPEQERLEHAAPALLGQAGRYRPTLVVRQPEQIGEGAQQARGRHALRLKGRL